MKTYYWEAKGKIYVENEIDTDSAREFLIACLDRDNGAMAVNDVILSVKEERGTKPTSYT